MLTLKRYSRMLFIAASLVGLATLLASYVPTSWSANVSYEEGQVAFNQMSLKYDIVKDDDDYIVSYQYARDSVTAVQVAASNMRQVAEQFAHSKVPFKATVVFAQPLSIEEFSAFAKDAGVVPMESILRGLDGNGQFIKIGLPPVWAQTDQGYPTIGKPLPGGAPIDPDALTRVLGGWQDVKIVGVISTDVVLDLATYQKVQVDQRVYAVDALEQVLINVVQQKHPGTPIDKIHVQGSILYPALERNGLTKSTQP